MYVSWDSCETGAPCINPKRPYGNSDVETDIAELLGWELFVDRDGEKSLSIAQYELAQKLHKDTQTALQIALCTQSFKEGIYEMTKKYDATSWALKSNS